MQMKVCLEKSSNKSIFLYTLSLQLFINHSHTSELTEKIIKLIYLLCNIMLCYIPVNMFIAVVKIPRYCVELWALLHPVKILNVCLLV